MRCKNHADNMETGSLLKLGPKCFNRATVMMKYVEIVIDDIDVASMEAPLCDSCYEYAAKSAKELRQRRKAKHGTLEGAHWVRRISKTPLIKPDATPNQ